VARPSLAPLNGHSFSGESGHGRCLPSLEGENKRWPGQAGRGGRFLRSNTDQPAISQYVRSIPAGTFGNFSREPPPCRTYQTARGRHRSTFLRGDRPAGGRARISSQEGRKRKKCQKCQKMPSALAQACALWYTDNSRPKSRLNGLQKL